jgi:hypothetical protein
VDEREHALAIMETVERDLVHHHALRAPDVIRGFMDRFREHLR